MLFTMALSSPSWYSTAAYLYTLSLSGSDLAWEYLRRNIDYRHCWDQYGMSDKTVARNWGLQFPGGP
jgi:Family of unknown function (DUF6499)